MIIRWQDRDWRWEPDEIDVEMARRIRDFTGRGLRSWARGIEDGEVDSLLSLWWAVQYQNGVDVPIDTVTIDSPTAFLVAVDTAAREEIERRLGLASKQKKAKFSPKDSKTPRQTRTSGTTGTGTSS